MKKLLNKIPITQEDPFGCRVACAAFLLGKGYQEAKKYFDKKKVEEYGCDCPDIAVALNRDGLNYEWDKLTDINKVPNLSVIFTGKSDYYKAGHYVVKVGQQWMNPWISGKNIKEAKSGFQKELPRNNVEYCIYKKGSI